MLVNVHHDSPAEHRRLLLFGVVFVTIMAILIWLAIAVYQKKFEPVTMVTMKAERAGLQLAKGGDIRVHGVLVGQIREISQDGEEAVIKLGLKPEAATSIPANVSAQILPTTLFGQKYVALIDPEKPAEDSLEDGDVIPSDRVETNVELSRILGNLFPLLRAISPADLNATLYALSTALSGRGEQIGGLLDDMDGYVTRLNTRLPTLRKDLVLLADVAKSYEIAAPDLVRLMRNATVTAKTLAEKEDAFSAFLGDLTGMAQTTSRVLAENEAGLIKLGQLSRPLLRLMDTYSPEYPCLLRGLDRYTGRLAEVFQNGRVNQILELGSVQRPAYDAGDRPVYGEVGHGPWCVGLPDPEVPIRPIPLKDGSDQDELTGPTLPFASRSFANPTSGYAGTPAEQRLVNTLLASRGGTSSPSSSSRGSLATLLYGPQVRGTRVSR
ncbi:MCE family protein [Nocardioides pacificus]